MCESRQLAAAPLSPFRVPEKLQEHIAAEANVAITSPLRVRLKRIRTHRLKEEAIPEKPSTLEEHFLAAPLSPLRVSAKLQENIAAEANVGIPSPLRVRLKRMRTYPLKEVAVQEKPSTSEEPYRFFHRDQPPTRTRSSVTRDVYNFLTQFGEENSISDHQPDVAADIIKKMVDDGRANLVSLKNGKWRTHAVKKKKRRPIGKRKQCSLQSIAEKEKSMPEVAAKKRMPTDQRPLSPIYEPEVGTDDDHAAEQQFVAPATPQPLTRDSVSNNAHRTLPEGAYSPFARSLLINRAHDSLEKRRHLVTMAQQIISTPLPRKSVNLTANNKTAISPIISADSNDIRKKSNRISPWRVSDETKLPNTFVFGLNTSHSPSYSSDHIPKRHVYLPEESAPAPAAAELTLIANNSVQRDQEHSLPSNDSNGEKLPPLPEISSFNNENDPAPAAAELTLIANNCVQRNQEHSLPSNDSNSENLPPLPEIVSFNNENEPPLAAAELTLIGQNDSNGENLPPLPEISSFNNENENSENLLQKPNVRRTLQPRVPFKDITILEVQELSPWKNKAAEKSHSRFDETTNDNGAAHSPTKPHLNPSRLSRNLFGFEEFLSLQENKSHMDEATNGNGAAYSPTNLHQNSAIHLNQKKQSRNLFGFEEFLSSQEDESYMAPHDASQNVTLHEKLHRLKELRPTEQELPQVSKAAMPNAFNDALNTRQRNIKDMLCSTMLPVRPNIAPAANESAGLFTDFENSNATFDRTLVRRTYVREQPKRKRKQRVKLLFIDTDSSDNEQDSNEDSPVKRAPPHKRLKDIQHEQELQQFITSFNQECAEVEKFPVIIE
ncbi:protein dalmatian [Drosophila busckii]|uniref:protein dalmatian n=1 Tax=Drosophila busckii TaxID=30019 RepID=UPI00083F0A5D|nr:protein dalmatian [Drosophila busckii]